MKTLRTFKWKFLALPVIAAGAAVLILKCANPVDDPPLKWLSKIEFPITNDSFNIAQTLPEMMTMFNDTIVRFWYRSDSLPWYRSSDLTPLRPSNHARYYAGVAATYSYAGITWGQNHVYEWRQSDGVWKWDDLGEVIDILKGGYDSTNEGVFYDTGTGPEAMFLDYIKGDTVVMSIPRVDSICYDVTQDSMETKSFYPSLGLLTIGSTDPGVRGVLKMKDTMVMPASSVDSLWGITMSGVTTITLDPSSPPCSVTVRNLSASTVYNLRVVIYDSVKNFGDIAPFNTAMRLFPVVFDSIGQRWGQGIGSNLTVRIQQDSALQPDSIQVEVNLNGLVATEVAAMSNYITFSKIFINPYKLTDTLECHYIDVLAGHFIYAIDNRSDLKIHVDVSQYHLWDAGWCTNHTPALNSVNDLPFPNTVHADSFGMGSWYMGRNVAKMDCPEHATTLDSMATNVNLSADRLFPEWYYDSLEPKPFKMKSVAPVEYILSPIIEGLLGRMVDVRSTDPLIFTISAPAFKFRQMLATVRQRYERSGDMVNVEMPFPFNRESKQELQTKFRFTQVLTDLYFTPKLPDSTLGQPVRAFLDTLGISFTLFNPDQPLITAGATTAFVNVVNNKRFRVETNFTDIMNQWPDSITVTENIYVPVGTRVMAVNDLQNPLDTPAYKQYMGRMRISAITNMRTNMLFSWKVLDTTKLDLGYGTFPVPGAMESFNRLENPVASVNMNIFNHTNLYMYLYGLVAPQPLMDSLRNMPSDTVRKLIGDTMQAHQRGYISLLGSRGVRIPARGRRDSSNIELRKWQIDTMTRYDTCSWRWEASFIPILSGGIPVADTLRDTDYVFIQSWLHMEGINNMDSLLNLGK